MHLFAAIILDGYKLETTNYTSNFHLDAQANWLTELIKWNVFKYNCVYLIVAFPPQLPWPRRGLWTSSLVNCHRGSEQETSPRMDLLVEFVEVMTNVFNIRKTYLSNIIIISVCVL